jgi:NADH-quinone oxidoreductase subunit J
VNMLEFAFFGLCSLIALLGAIATVASKNPIRGAMGLLSTIVGIAGLYLSLAAEFLATIQLLVYAGAVVILFLFVIMLLGPSAVSKREAQGPWARYIGAGALFLACASLALLVIRAQPGAATMFVQAPAKFGTIESLGHELFTKGLIPFELSGALLLVAVVGAVAVARGKQIDPTLLPAADEKSKEAQS